MIVNDIDIEEAVVVMKPHLNICDGNACASALLHLFGTMGSTWSSHSIMDLHRHLFGIWGERSIAKALKILDSKGFVLSRRDPDNRFNHLRQYKYQPDSVRHAIKSKDYFDEKLERRKGYLYLIQSGKTTLHKIGHSKDVNRRLKELQRVTQEEELKVIVSVYYDDCMGVEQRWHDFFRFQAIGHEWFLLKPADVEYFLKGCKIK